MGLGIWQILVFLIVLGALGLGAFAIVMLTRGRK